MESAKVGPDGQRRAVIFRYLDAADAAAKPSRCGHTADWASESSTVAAEDDLPVHQKSRELLESRHMVSTSVWVAAQQGTPKSKGSSSPTSATSATPRCCSSSALESSFTAEDDLPMHQKSVERLEMRHIVSRSVWVAAEQGTSSSKLRTACGGSESADLSGTAGSDAAEQNKSDPPHAILADEADAEAEPGSLEEEKLAEVVPAPGAADRLVQDDERSTICAEEPDAISKPGSASSDSLPVAFTDSLPAAPLYDSPARGCTIEVHYYAATGPNGQVVLDTVFMELLVLAKWHGIELRLHASSYTSLPSLGELPVAFGGALRCMERRDHVLAALRKLCCFSDGQGHPGYDADLRELMERDIAGSISELLWRDAIIYEEYTWPVLLASSPGGFGRYWAWAERRRQLQKLPSDADPSSTLGRLAVALDTLAARLGDGDSFLPQVAAVTPLDASAFAHLAVIFGIACKQGSQLKRVLTKHSNLANFCLRLQERLSAWPCAGTFLAGLGA